MPHFVYAFIDWRWYLQNVNHAAGNTGVRVHLSEFLVSLLLGKCLGVELLDRMAILCLISGEAA